MKDRIVKVIQYTNLSNAEFAEKLGISTSSLSHIMSERNKPSLPLIMSIHEAYPEINLYWLMFGEGEMLTGGTVTVNDLFTEHLKDTVGEMAEQSIPDEGLTISLNSSKSIPKLEGGKDGWKIVEKPAPKITEIRVFYDNGTYEVFKPEK